MGNTYSVRDAARILKVTPSRLRYWKRTALVPVRDGDREAGKREGFDFRDLIAARAVLTLVKHGVPLRRIRQSVEILREHVPELEEPLSALRPWSEGSARMVVRHGDALLEPDGQMLLDFQGEVGGSDVRAFEPQRDSTAEAPQAGDAMTAIDYFELGCTLDADATTYDRALEAYRRAVELEAGFADAHCNLGAVLYNKGGRAAARRSFERCLELEPAHIEAHFNLANVLEEDGCDELALTHYQAALEGDPHYADLHVNLALLHEKLAREQDALAHWGHYLQIEPNGTWAELAKRRLGV